MEKGNIQVGTQTEPMKQLDDDDFERGEETMGRDSLPPLDDLVMT